MKKLLSVLLACTMSITLFAGCKSSSPSKDTSSSANTSSAEKTSSEQKDVKWPTSNIQLIVPAKAGGGSDIQARVFAQYLQEATGKPVVVVNQDSGGGSVANETVRTAKPDGHTLLYTHTGIIVNYYTGIYEHPITDFTPISIMQTMGSQVYVVSSNSKYNTMKDLIDDSKANPGKVKVGIQTGGTSHFIAGQIMKVTGANFKLVEAANEVDKVAAIQGGHIDTGNMTASAAKQYVDAGKLKVLGMIESDPDPKFPEFVPIVKQGVNARWAANMVLFGPKGMDPALVEKINAITKGMETDKNAQEKLKQLSCVYKYYNLQDTQKYIQEQDDRIGALAKDLGVSKR